MKELGELTHQDFEALEGQAFVLREGALEVPLTLLRVRSRAWSGPGRVPFSLLFAASSGAALPQRIYRLTHVREGELELFLVPVGRDARGLLLEATFS
jgi:hypothetical protein